MLREGFGNDRSVARSVNLGDDVDTTLEVREVNNTEWRSRVGGSFTSLAYSTISAT